MRRAIVMSPHVFEPPLTPASIDVRAATVVYAQVIGGVEFGNTWDRTYPVASSTNKRVSGFRFQVNIPKDAIIDAATLETTHSQNATWSAPADDLDVAFEQSDSTSTATNEPNAETLSANIGSTVNWSITGAKVSGDKFVTPDLASLLQTIVNRAGWASGNYATIWAISDGGGNDAHQMWAVTGVTTLLQPRLQVDYRS